jgi:DNA-directed RNA polymerase specialized sigma24 family protein
MNPLDLTSSPTATGTKRPLMFLAVGLLSFAILWAVPVALVVWLFGFAFGSVGIAELLERTRGLAPTTYGGAFWLAVTITVVMAVLEVRAMARKPTERPPFLIRFITRPSTAFIVLFFPTLLLVRLDIRGTDVPDIITTTLLLCCLGYIYFILPLALAAVSWRITRWMWRLGSSSSFAAGLLGMLGLAFASCTPLVCAVNDDDESPSPRLARIDDAIGRGFDELERQDAVDGSRAFMGALAEVIENEPKRSPPSNSSSTTKDDVDKDRFGECVKELYRGHPNSLRNQKVSVFVLKHRLDQSTAEEIVDDAVLKLCTRHAIIGSEPYANLAAVFNLRADSRRKNWFRKQGNRNRCVTMAYGSAVTAEDPLTVESSAIDRALCSLDEADRRILELSAIDHEARWIGEQLGLSPEAVRQRKRRALESIRRLLQLH